MGFDYYNRRLLSPHPSFDDQSTMVAKNSYTADPLTKHIKDSLLLRLRKIVNAFRHAISFITYLNAAFWDFFLSLLLEAGMNIISPCGKQNLKIDKFL